MDNQTVEVLTQILNLGWPAIVLIMIIILWRAYEKRTSDFIAFQTKILEEYMRDCPPGPDQVHVIQPRSAKELPTPPHVVPAS